MSKKLTQKLLDQRCLEITSDMAKYATCLRLKVGAVVMSKDNKVIGLGYNDSVNGKATCEDEGECLHINNNDRCIRCIHAEQAAILGVYDRAELIDGTIYVTHYPCENCSKMILHSGIKRVVYINPYENKGSEYFLADLDVEQVKIKRIEPIFEEQTKGIN